MALMVIDVYSWIENVKKAIKDKDIVTANFSKRNLKEWIQKCIDFNPLAVYPVESGRILYRGRIYKETDQFERWDKYDISEGQPFRGYGKAESFVNNNLSEIKGNRCNYKGEQCLYVSEKRETCYVELRPQANTLISLAEIVVVKPLNVLDFSSSGAIGNTMEMADFFLALNSELNKPVYSSEDGYRFTQFVAECVKELGFDGIRYSSAFNTLTMKDRGKNIAIFNFEKCEAHSSELVFVKSVDVNVENK